MISWTKGLDHEWVNKTQSGQVYIIGGRKIFFPLVDQAFNCGHWRHVPAVGAEGLEFQERLEASHSDSSTDLQYVLRDKTGEIANNDNSGFGFYLTGGNILIKDGTSGYLGEPVPYEPGEVYTLTITIGAEVTTGYAKLTAQIKHHGDVLAEEESEDTYFFIGKDLHPWIWASRIGGVNEGIATLR